MELRHLRLVKTLAEEKGIVKSLDKLFLTQSAVSHQLRDFEERLGAKLFYRTKNQWILTEEGKVVYNTAVTVLAEIERATKKIGEMRNGISGKIRISTECYTVYNWLPPFMVQMKMLYPNLEITVVIEATYKPLQKLLENELDVGITSDPWEDKSIKYIELFKDEVMAVLPSGHPLSAKKFLSGEDFAENSLIIHSYPLETVSVHQHYLKNLKIQPAKIIAMPLTEAALQMVKAGMGIMTMPKWATRPFVATPDLTLVRIGNKGLVRTHYAAIRHEDADKKYLRDFIQNLKEELVKWG